MVTIHDEDERTYIASVLIEIILGNKSVMEIQQDIVRELCEATLTDPLTWRLMMLSRHGELFKQVEDDITIAIEFILHWFTQMTESRSLNELMLYGSHELYVAKKAFVKSMYAMMQTAGSGTLSSCDYLVNVMMIQSFSEKGLIEYVEASPGDDNRPVLA